MKVRRRFLLALVASLMLHVGVLSGPGWWPAALDDDSGVPAPIEAHLAEPVRTVAPAQAKPKPRKKPRPVPELPAPAPPAAPAEEPVAAATPTPTEPVAPEAAAEPETIAEVVRAPVEIALPKRVRIHYEVAMGDNGFVIGAAIQDLHHDGMAYSLRNAAETTGLAAFFRPAKVVNVSEGEVAAGGLRPREFRVERSYGKKSESASFDWPMERVTLTGGREFALVAGAQDMLSMFCQLALLPADGAAISLPVVTGKRVERYDFVVIGEERLAMPFGERATLHLAYRADGSEESIDVWLGLEDSRLPVKIRHVNRRGDVFVQTADRIEYETEGQR